MHLVGDCECNDLIDYNTGQFPTKLHCAVFCDVSVKPNKWYEFIPDDWIKPGDGYYPISQLKDLLEKSKKVTMHNLMGYDRHVFEKLAGYLLPLEKCDDTLIKSRMSYPRRPGGHSIENWASTVGGVQKVQHEDWSTFSFDMLHRCKTDVFIGIKVNNTVNRELKSCSQKSIIIEHKFVDYLEEQKKNGFYRDKKKVEALYASITSEMKDIETQLRKIFKPLPVRPKKGTKYYKKKVKGDGTLHKRCRDYLDTYGLPEDTGDHSVITYEDFNPGSARQRVKHLLAIGWTPSEYTKTGQPKSPKADDVSLENIKIPEVKLFGRYLKLQSYAGTLEQWIEGADSNGYVHCSIIHIEPWTHRSAHRAPNMGNVPSVDKNPEFGPPMRECWQVDSADNVLVGADASGIQSRALAHYIAESTGQSEYVDIVANPNVDIHLYNMDKSGIQRIEETGPERYSPKNKDKYKKGRAKSKTFFYAFVLNSGYYKTGLLTKPDEDEYERLYEWMLDNTTTGYDGKPRPIKETLDYSMEYMSIPKTMENYAIATKGFQVKNTFINNVPGLADFKSKGGFIGKRGKIGNVIMPDGRFIRLPEKNAYHVMAALLQGFEAVAMRVAILQSRKLLNDKGIWFKERNYVHDEVQRECRAEDAHIVGQAFVDAIEWTGDYLNSLCPLTGEYQIGNNWAETH